MWERQTVPANSPWYIARGMVVVLRATKRIGAGEQLYVSYGEEYCEFLNL